MSQDNIQNDTAYDAFISYSSKDKNITDSLCHFLEEKKIRCWMAPRNLLPGQEYSEAIEQAMNNVKVFILICSNCSLRSQWVHKETNLAVSDKKIIIPFRIENCSLEGTGMKLYLNDRHWIDAVLYPNDAFDNLATALFSILASNKKETDLGEKKYKFNTLKDKVYSKIEIIKIAKLQIWLFFYFLMSVFLYFLAFADESILFLCIAATLNIVAFLILRIVEKESIFVTIIAILMMLVPFVSSFIFLYEIAYSRKILHSAGMKTSFWGVSKSNIANFEKS